ncbi:unnamed protein product [Paramecium primaurelia]|uniref:Malectin domain-containing protein n=1 Tax=Paramecium primaurelia TaxID=5886 RepID=A0A8S1LKG4_PARPR|nr:unnamed protein product [Paramecium primaurelia]CAD8065824.1 unnamed protein product [Paramecium primaurelia]
MIQLFIILALAFSKPLNPKKVLYAINCGAPSNYKSPSGIQYEKDIQTDPETVVADYSLNSEVSSQQIKYTREPEIYLTERHAYKTFSYQIPLQKEGTYTLILKFAEMYFDTKGKRVFHVKFGSQRVIEKLDIVAKVGKYASNDEYIEFEYIAGQVFHNNVLCVDAVQDGKLQVNLEKTKFDNPYIHGIVLYAGGIVETDYEEYQYMKENWDKVINEEKIKEEYERQKKSEAKVKRKERVKIRNDHLNVVENEFEFDDQSLSTSVPVAKKVGLKALITSPFGTAGLFISFFIGMSILNKIISTISNAKIKGIEKDITESKPKQEKQVKEKNDTSDKKNKTKETKDKSKAKQQ